MSFPPYQPFGRPPQMMPHAGFMPAWLPTPPAAPSVPLAPAPPVAEPAKPKSSIAAAALQSAKMKRGRQMIVQSIGPKKPVVESAAVDKPTVSSSTQGPAEQAAPAEAQPSEMKRRKRWDVLESDAPSAPASSSAAVVEAAAAPPSSELAPAVKKPNDYEEQLRAQKEIQFLEARIRSMRVR